MGRNLYPKAPDMRARATQSLSDGELYSIIKNGVRLTGMPAWGAPGDADEETWALVHFIRRLPALTPDDLADMRRRNPRGYSTAQQVQHLCVCGHGASTDPAALSTQR